MTPQGNILSQNPMGLDANQASNVVGTVGSYGTPQANSPQTNQPSQTPNPDYQNAAGTFSECWKRLMDLQTKHGGDMEDFNNLQKAAERWFSGLVNNIPPTAPAQNQPQ